MKGMDVLLLRNFKHFLLKSMDVKQDELIKCFNFLRSFSGRHFIDPQSVKPLIEHFRKWNLFCLPPRVANCPSEIIFNGNKND